MCKPPSCRMFDYFMLLPVDIANHPDWIRVYDFNDSIIYDNTTRREDANIIGFRPKRK